MTPQSLYDFTKILLEYPKLRPREIMLVAYLSLVAGRVDFTVCAEATKLLKPALCDAMDRLMEYDFVQRFADEEDKRFRWLAITDAGRAFVKQLLEAAG